MQLATFYELAKSERITPYSSGFPWPYEVAVSFDGVRYCISVSEGVAHGAAGAMLSAQEAISPTWESHFENAKGGWLIPHIKKIAAGESVDVSAILKEFEVINGRKPATFEAKVVA